MNRRPTTRRKASNMPPTVRIRFRETDVSLELDGTLLPPYTPSPIEHLQIDNNRLIRKLCGRRFTRHLHHMWKQYMSGRRYEQATLPLTKRHFKRIRKQYTAR